MGSSNVQMALIRVGQSEAGTFGVLRQGDIPFAVTLELPWRDNTQRQSCIPAGTYSCRRIVSPRIGETFEVCEVPGRSQILFHPGNSLADTEGCILIGEEFDRGPTGPIISFSRRGFHEFLARLEGVHAFELVIVPPPIVVAHGAS